MPLLKSEFKFLDRGFKDTLVLIPGWATDYRIFNRLKLDYNYILTTKLSLSNFNQALLSQLDEFKINKVSVFGFSMGAFLAAGFAAGFPEKITELILVGVRNAYNPEILEDIKCKIQKNKRSWLYKFYINCFSRADAEALAWFRNNLLEEYTDNLDMQELLRGLNYLASQALQPKTLKKIENIRIFHGSKDIIAPIREVLKIKSDLPQAKLIYLEDAGHLSFLNSGFREKFYGA
jgi:pimeloyl-ACP methyl ester carboxylesterase